MEIEAQLSKPGAWDKPEELTPVLREKSGLEFRVGMYDALTTARDNVVEWLELAQDGQEDDALEALNENLDALEKRLGDTELAILLNGPDDNSAAILEIHPGAGGVDAQDWAEMLLRMYLRWCESRGWKTELLEVSGGDVAGIKSATFRVEGDYAYGWLKTEIGVHRLVRKSPFDSDNRRHTSFTSVFVSPEVDDDIDIEINPADIKMDVYRSSGAGGQHVNKTESAVRLHHLPTGVVVACQTERSQHSNRDRAMKMLKAKLYELEVQKRNAEKNALEATKSDIGWGSQIRNYVLDQSRIKDLRTGVERSDTQNVLDGDLDEFIEASLKAGLEAGAKRVDA